MNGREKLKPLLLGVVVMTETGARAVLDGAVETLGIGGIVGISD